MEIEKSATGVAILGFSLDHLSTRVALTHPLIYEANPTTRILMEKSLWLPLDIIILMIMICIPLAVIRYTTLKNRRVVMISTLIFGILRLLAGLWNIAIFLNLMW